MKALSVFFIALLLPFIATAQESCEPELSYKYLTHKGIQYELKNVHGILHGLMAGFYKDEKGNTIIVTVITRDLQCNAMDWECWFMAKGLPEVGAENSTQFKAGQVCIQVTFEEGKPMVCEEKPQSLMMADLQEDFTKLWEVSYASIREKVLMDSYAKYIEIQADARLSLASYFNHFAERINTLEIEVSDLIAENESLKKKLEDK